MQIPFDCHVHTLRSACGEDITDQWLFSQARTRDLCFAVTDHTMHLYYEPEIAWAMYRDDAIELFAARRDSGRERILRYLADLRSGECPNLLVGVELDVLPDGQIMFPDDIRDALDICLGAHHLLPTASQKAPPAEVDSEFRQQTTWLLEYGVDVLAHPFRIVLSANYEVGEELIAWTVALARAHNTALEINSHKPFPDHDVAMVREAVRAGVRLACGTDAHNSREFGVFDYHRDIFARAGLTDDQASALLFTPEQCGLAH